MRDSVAAIREVLGGHERYRELTYQELRADPAAALRGVFAWLGVDAGESVLARVRTLSEERFAKAIPDPPPQPAQGGPGLSRLPRAIARRARGLARRTRGSAVVPGETSPANRLVQAMIAKEPEAIRAATADTFALELRSGDGDLRVEGEPARAALLEVAGLLFSRRFINVDWRPAEQGTAFTFQALTGDTSRVDVALHAFVSGNRVLRLTVISAGDLTGRPMERWSPPG